MGRRRVEACLEAKLFGNTKYDSAGLAHSIQSGKWDQLGRTRIVSYPAAPLWMWACLCRDRKRYRHTHAHKPQLHRDKRPKITKKGGNIKQITFNESNYLHRGVFNSPINWLW
jgi:hypothetical protein